MKIKALEEIEKHEPTLLSHVILECLSHSAMAQIVETEDYKENGELDICVTINGHEANIQKLVDHWQSEVENMINDECRSRLKGKYHELITDKFEKISEVMDDLNDRMYTEIRARVAEWEKEDYP